MPGERPDRVRSGRGRINWQPAAHDGLESGRARSRRARSSSGRRPVTPSQRGARRVQRGIRNRIDGVGRALRAAPLGPGRPGRAPGLDRSRSPPSSGTSVSLRRALFYFDITEINYPYRAFFADELQGRPVLALVPGALLRPAALQREPGGLSASAQVSALSLAGDLAGVQPRHGALGLADRRGDLSLAAAARRAGGGTDRRRGLRRERATSGAT